MNYSVEINQDQFEIIRDMLASNYGPDLRPEERAALADLIKQIED